MGSTPISASRAISLMVEHHSLRVEILVRLQYRPLTRYSVVINTLARHASNMGLILIVGAMVCSSIGRAAPC